MPTPKCCPAVVGGGQCLRAGCEHWVDLLLGLGGAWRVLGRSSGVGSRRAQATQQMLFWSQKNLVLCFLGGLGVWLKW
jgi:hypothetical protein